jgi:hypothetical protein
MVIEADLAPVPVGLKATKTLQLTPAASPMPQWF